MRTRDGVDGFSNADHLRHPGAWFGGDEVLPDAGPHIARATDVEGTSARVAEGVNARPFRQAFGEMTLSSYGRWHQAVERVQLLERPHPEIADPLEQAVQDIGRCARVRQCSV